MSRATVILAVVLSSIENANSFVTVLSSVSQRIQRPFIVPQKLNYATKMSLFPFNNDDDDDDNDDDTDISNNGRRSFLFQSLLTPILTSSSPSNAYEEGEDLTSKLYNPDGSLRSGAALDEIESKSKSISNIFPGVSTTDAIVSYDGSSPISSSTNEEIGSHSSVKISYSIPEKWVDRDEVKYVDTSEGINAQACSRITIYQAQGSSTEKALIKATTNGVAKTLGMTTSIGYSPTVAKADLISGRKSASDEDTYYEFDLAVAPQTCPEKSSDNLGLGFCPYDSILLASAIVKDGRMYVCTVECSKDQWKRSSSDLKRVRSSFTVQ